MEKGKGKEMKETVVQDRKSCACMSIPDLSVGVTWHQQWKEHGKTELPMKREAKHNTDHYESRFLTVGAKQDKFHKCHNNGDIKDSKARSLSS